MKCVALECGIPLVSKHSWYVLGIQPEGHLPNAGRDMCRRHYHRFTKFGSPDVVLPERNVAGRPRDEVLEDYLMIRDDVASIRQAADRMGMTFHALDRALYRARLDGDDRAMPPSTQALRAASRGMPYRIAA